MTNSVCIYSNGTTVLAQTYPFADGKALEIAIPVRKKDLDAVVASIEVLGEVAVLEPPNFSPTNANSAELQLDADNALYEIATKLRGATCEVTTADGRSCSGKLAGIQPFKTQALGGVLETFHLLVLADPAGNEPGGIRFFKASEITSILPGPDVLPEVLKTLKNSYEQIKPDSAYVTVRCRPKGQAANAVVQYAYTGVPWLPRYQLRQGKDGWTLDVKARVVNNGEQDWTNCMITVVSGEPVDFNTDYAEIQVPSRQRVNFAPEAAHGAVTADEEVYDGRESVQAKTMRRVGMPSASPAMAFGGAASLQQLASGDANLDIYYSEQQEAVVGHAGDFATYTSPEPVDKIGSNKAALIHLQSHKLAEVSSVLLFKHKDHPTRPWRAERFVNNTGQALTRGVGMVVQDGMFTGKFDLKPCQMGEEAYLVHELEVGVRINRADPKTETRQVRITVVKGVATWESRQTVETVYGIMNLKPDAFRLELEHPKQFNDGNFTVAVGDETAEPQVKTIASGIRVGLDLAAGSGNKPSKAAVTVRETRVSQTGYNLVGDQGYKWLNDQVISKNLPLREGRERLQAVIGLQKTLTDARQAVTDTQQVMNDATQEQDRLLRLVDKAHDKDAQRWRNDLAAAEDRFRQHRDRLPELQRQVRKAEQDLQDGLTALCFDWAEGT